MPRRLVLKGKEAMRRILILSILPVLLASIVGCFHTFDLCDGCSSCCGDGACCEYGDGCQGGDSAPSMVAPAPVDKKPEALPVPKQAEPPLAPADKQPE